MRGTPTSILTGILAALAVAAAAPAQAAEPAVKAAMSRAGAAGVAASRLEVLVARAEARNVPAHAVVEGLAAVEAAAARGLPVGPVIDKLLEGFAKGVPAQRMLPVVQEVVSRLGKADAALRDLPATHAARGSLVEQGAEALRRGASADALAAVADAAGGDRTGRLGLGIRELGDLGEARVGGADAGRALGLMVRQGYPDAAIAGLSEQVREALAEGASPSELLAEIQSRAAAGRPLERLVDPFSERPGAVIHDHAGDRAVPELPDAAKVHGKHGASPGRSPLERPGAAGSLDAAQDKKARSKGGRPDKEPPVGPRNPPR